MRRRGDGRVRVGRGRRHVIYDARGVVLLLIRQPFRPFSTARQEPPAAAQIPAGPDFPPPELPLLPRPCCALSVPLQLAAARERAGFRRATPAAPSRHT